MQEENMQIPTERSKLGFPSVSADHHTTMHPRVKTSKPNTFRFAYFL